MTFFGRLMNIIRSNINYESDNTDINYGSYDFKQDIKEDYTHQFEHNSFEEFQKPEEENIEREYYGILELEYGADFDKIKSAYKKLLKRYHPDLYHESPEKYVKAQKLTEKINEAYSYFEEKSKY